MALNLGRGGGLGGPSHKHLEWLADLSGSGGEQANAVREGALPSRHLQKLLDCISFYCLREQLEVPAVLVVVEELGRDCCGVSRLVPHFISHLPAHRDVDQLKCNAFTLKDSHHLCLLGLDLPGGSHSGVVQFDCHSCRSQNPL